MHLLRIPTLPNGVVRLNLEQRPIRSNMNAVSWRKTDPGLGCRYKRRKQRLQTYQSLGPSIDSLCSESSKRTDLQNMNLILISRRFIVWNICVIVYHILTSFPSPLHRKEQIKTGASHTYTDGLTCSRTPEHFGA